MPVWLIPSLLVGGGALIGSQVKDGIDAVFKEPGGGVPRPSGGLNFNDKANALFTLALLGAGIFIFVEGKKALKG